MAWNDEVVNYPLKQKCCLYAIADYNSDDVMLVFIFQNRQPCPHRHRYPSLPPPYLYVCVTCRDSRISTYIHTHKAIYLPPLPPSCILGIQLHLVRSPSPLPLVDLCPPVHTVCIGKVSYHHHRNPLWQSDSHGVRLPTFNQLQHPSQQIANGVAKFFQFSTGDVVWLLIISISS